jgi:hypothetical protein
MMKRGGGRACATVKGSLMTSLQVRTGNLLNNTLQTKRFGVCLPAVCVVRRSCVTV